MRRSEKNRTKDCALCLSLLLLAGCAAPAAQTPPPAPAMTSGMARLWVLRQANPPGGNVDAAAPMVYANGVPLAPAKEGTAYFHDFVPGTYRLTVQAYGTPTGRGDTVQLAPGMQSYVQVMGVPNWQVGSTAGGGSFQVLAMAPQTAQEYLPTVTNLGQR
ncbi:MAG TPA: hypothetical protein VGF34_18130 [Stellaceae bacterium]|jgi:hypothetical protein